MQARTLADVQARGDTRWFQPALDVLASLPSEPDDGARPFLSLENPCFVARAPGRLDVMGGIADYSGATVLQLPLDRSTTVVAESQAVPRVDLATRRGGRWTFFSIDIGVITTGELREPARLAEWFASRPEDHWAAYIIGVLQYCVTHASETARISSPGLRCLIDSAVPEGKGVSSSAALEVAAMSAAAAVYRLAMSGEEMAAACQWVENHIVGAPCGIMDQMTSACGKNGRLLRLRCQPGTIEGHLEIPDGYRFYGVDSGVRHAVTGADYSTVRTAAFMGYRIIAAAAGLQAHARDGRVSVDDPIWHGYLANMSPVEFGARFRSVLPQRMIGADFLARYSGTTDSVTRVVPNREYPVFAATSHPIHEQDRVVRFAELLGDLAERPAAAVDLGRLMYEAHASYSACGLGSDATDRLVELVAEVGASHGLYGAKITGGGSGGTVAILGDATALPAVSDLAARYNRETGRVAEVFADSGPGAEDTGILILD